MTQCSVLKQLRRKGFLPFTLFEWGGDCFSPNISLEFKGFLSYFFRILSKKDGNVIARNVFHDEAIPWITPGDCFGKKRLAMTRSITINY